MNLPNKLTIARTLLVPVFLVFLLVPGIPFRYILACLVFAAASFTDYLDGKIARSRGLVTSFGKFLDPLADKVLVTSALVAFVQLGFSGPVPVVIVVARDMMVSGIRMIAATSDGQVIAANWWGKVKTASQMVVIIAVLVAAECACAGMLPMETVEQASCIAMWAVAAFTAVSGVVYLVQNKSLINTFQ